MANKKRMTGAESERAMIAIQKLKEQGKRGQEIIDELGLTKNQYTNLTQKMKKRGGVSNGDMTLAHEMEVLRKKLKEVQQSHNEMQRALRGLPDEIKEMVKKQIIANRRSDLEAEMQREIELVTKRYQEMAEEELPI